MRLRKVFRKVFGLRKSDRSELSTPTIHRAVLHAIDRAGLADLTGDYLDVGSGAGELLTLVQKRYGVRHFACDYT
ncbi:MAG: hypothetical protein ACREIW_00900, partial [Chthoniobacterales bacterium]